LKVSDLLSECIVIGAAATAFFFISTHWVSFFYVPSIYYQ
jgi:hypothetical protein